MSDFVILTCPSCGGKLKITSDIDRFYCSFCGNEFIVKRAGGIVSLSPVIDEIRSVKRSVDRTNSELSILRLQNDISQLQHRLEIISPKRKKGITTIISSIPMVLLVIFLTSFSQSNGFQTVIISVLLIAIIALIFSVWKLKSEETEINKEIFAKKKAINKYLKN